MILDNLPQKVRIVEVGPRDGLQNEKKPLSVDDRVHLIRRLADAGLDTIEAGSFVSPKWVPQMADTDKVIAATAGMPQNLPVLVPNSKGMELAVAAEVKEIAVFTATSESFSQRNTNCSVAEGLERIATITRLAAEQGIRVRGYVSTVLDCPYDGPQDPEVAAEIAARLIEMGCYEVSLGDTIGKGTPLRTRQMLAAVLSRVPADKLAVHFHDTWGQALANILVALQMGISVVDSSVGGLGGCPYAKGASGNVATEDVVFMLEGMGIETGVNLPALVETAHWIAERLEKTLPGKVQRAMN